MCRYEWYDGGYKECAATSMKYKGVGSDLVTITSADRGQVTDYSTGISPTYDSTSVSVESTSAYGGNVDDLSTEINGSFQVISNSYPIGGSTSATTANYTAVEITNVYGREMSDCCTGLRHSS